MAALAVAVEDLAVAVEAEEVSITLCILQDALPAIMRQSKIGISDSSYRRFRRW